MPKLRQIIRRRQGNHKIHKSSRRPNRISKESHSEHPIPQANDVEKIIQFPARISEGYDSSEQIVDAFGFVVRQGAYYRQASETLGLIEKRGKKYRITPKGEQLLILSDEQKIIYVCQLLLQFPVMHEVFEQISGNYDRVVSRRDVVKLVRRESTITGSTVSRRVQTIVAWFRWIQNNLGLVEVDMAGNIRLARQQRLSF